MPKRGSEEERKLISVAWKQGNAETRKRGSVRAARAPDNVVAGKATPIYPTPPPSLPALNAEATKRENVKCESGKETCKRRRKQEAYNTPRGWETDDAYYWDTRGIIDQNSQQYSKLHSCVHTLPVLQCVLAKNAFAKKRGSRNSANNTSEIIGKKQK